LDSGTSEVFCVGQGDGIGSTRVTERVQSIDLVTKNWYYRVADRDEITAGTGLAGHSSANHHEPVARVVHERVSQDGYCLPIADGENPGLAIAGKSSGADSPPPQFSS